LRRTSRQFLCESPWKYFEEPPSWLLNSNATSKMKNDSEAIYDEICGVTGGVSGSVQLESGCIRFKALCPLKKKALTEIDVHPKGREIRRTPLQIAALIHSSLRVSVVVLTLHLCVALHRTAPHCTAPLRSSCSCISRATGFHATVF
jgi:hypothetical protein